MSERKAGYTTFKSDPSVLFLLNVVPSESLGHEIENLRQGLNTKKLRNKAIIVGTFTFP